MSSHDPTRDKRIKLTELNEIHQLLEMQRDTLDRATFIGMSPDGRSLYETRWMRIAELIQRLNMQNAVYAAARPPSESDG
jgi:hypothetical protein